MPPIIPLHLKTWHYGINSEFSCATINRSTIKPYAFEIMKLTPDLVDKKRGGNLFKGYILS